MEDSHAFVFHQTVSLKTVKELCRLWQRVALYGGQEAILVTEKSFFPENQLSASAHVPQYLRLLICPHFSILLLGYAHPNEKLYHIKITWDSPKIEELLTYINSGAILPSPLQEYLKTLKSYKQAYRWEGLSQFSLELLEILSIEDEEELRESNYSPYYPLEQALHDQIEEERLLNQVISQIHQGRELGVILATAVKEARKFLKVDRLLIYQFKDIPENNSNSIRGKITYEAKGSTLTSSMLNIIPEDDCFSYIPHYREKYRRGEIVSIEDVEVSYSSSFCLAEFLRNYAVRSVLIAPIVVKEKLWGLIIAHQCLQPRKWQEKEKTFLGNLGAYLAIAIEQSHLYEELTTQKKNFEQRVFECTQELRDTLATAQIYHQYKSEFLSNISHELLTPLTCVIGLAGTLLHWSEDESLMSPDKQKKYIRIIRDNGKKLMNIINDILDYSSITSGSYQLNIQEFSLYKLASLTLEDFQEEAEKKAIELMLDFQVKADKNSFNADQDRVKQILFHLLSNAIKFTPDGGQVILRVWREMNYVFFQVEDTGIGISSEQLPLLFEQFQQLESSRQRTYGGTGLGLALTKQLIELHRGTIEVESIPQQGTLFTVRLPDRVEYKPGKNATVEQKVSPKPSEDRTIVLLSQDEETATLICELVTINNYQIIWLVDSYSGIKQIEALHPLLIIIDQEIPHSDKIGIRLKQFPTTQNIKVLVLRNSLRSLNWQSLANQGIDDYLLKPIEPNLLLKKISFLMSLTSPENTEVP